MNQSDQQNNAETAAENNTEETDKDIFDVEFDELTNKFSDLAKSHDLEIGYMVAVHPITGQLYLYTIGHEYDVTLHMHKISQGMRDKLISQLE